MIMGVTYMFNIFIKIRQAMSLIYFMKHIKLPNMYNIEPYKIEPYKI